jgi:hypothetical protein
MVLLILVSQLPLRVILPIKKANLHSPQMEMAEAMPRLARTHLFLNHRVTLSPLPVRTANNNPQP